MKYMARVMVAAIASVMLIGGGGVTVRAETAEALIQKGLDAMVLPEKQKFFEEALQVDPGNPVAMNNLATCFEFKEDYEQALAWYSKAICAARALKLDFPDPWFGMGDVYYSLRQFKNAWLAWNEGLKRRPESPETKERLAGLRQQFPSYFDSKGEFLMQEPEEIVASLTLHRGTGVRPKVDLVIEFDTGSDQIKPECEQQVENLARALGSGKFGNTRFVIAGHTDSRGEGDYNKALSERRARAVFQRLVDTYHLDAALFETLGYGEERLKVPREMSDDDYQANRRVEIAPK